MSLWTPTSRVLPDCAANLTPDRGCLEASLARVSHIAAGHDVQFSSMLDGNVSLIRARYAFNNVNTEGWGLYAEDLVFPYLSQKEQLVALQTRLWRIARTFLDPSPSIRRSVSAELAREALANRIREFRERQDKVVERFNAIAAAKRIQARAVPEFRAATDGLIGGPKLHRREVRNQPQKHAGINHAGQIA